MKSQKAGVQRLSRKFLHSEETEAFPLMVRREPGRVVVEHTLHPREKRVISKSHRYENSEGRSKNWFDDLDPKSVDSFEELSQKFLEEFSQLKRYVKDLTEINRVKIKQGEGLQAFIDRFKAESSHIKGMPLVLRISTFMYDGHLELAKKLND
ncbi:reverse transcriptase domain-containing protein [Tanacetum coccineum]